MKKKFGEDSLLTTALFFYMLVFVIQQSKVSDAAIYRICSETFIQTPTLLFLQTPLFLGKKGDRIICTEEEDQTLLGAALYLLLQECNPAPIKEPEQILLVSQDMLPQIGKFIESIPFKRLKMKSPTLLGFEDLAKKEHPLLKSKSKGIITTPERLVDHIRLGNISVKRVSELILVIPEEAQLNRFERDTLFIEDKMPKGRNIISYQEGDRTPLHIPEISMNPTTISRTEWRYSKADYNHHFTPEPEQLMMEFLYATPYEQGAILTTTEDLEGLDKRMKSSPHFNSIAKNFTITDSPKLIRKSEHIEFLIITHIEGGKDFDHLIEIITNFHELQEVLFLLPPTEKIQFTKWKEKQNMESNEKGRPTQEEIIAGKIRDMVSEFRTNADPDLMKQYQRIIKKNTSFFDRGHLLTFLVAQALEGKGNNSRRNNRKEHSRGETPKREPREPRDNTPSENMQTLFISAGKNKKVFAGNLIKFLITQGELEKEEIGKIRSLPNYSFVEVPVDKAESLVTKLNDAELNGRPVTVNIANQK